MGTSIPCFSLFLRSFLQRFEGFRCFVALAFSSQRTHLGLLRLLGPPGCWAARAGGASVAAGSAEAVVAAVTGAVRGAAAATPRSEKVDPRKKTLFDDL